MHFEHLEDLRRSGLSDQTIRQQRFRSVPRALVKVLLDFTFEGLLSAMLLPFANPVGGFMDHIRLKVFPPLRDAKGHSVKYLQPRASGLRLFFARATLQEALHGDEPLWLVEGEKKSLAVAQLGLPAIGFCGIEGWHVAGSRDLLPDFEWVRLRRRRVELVPDGDWQTNPNVSRGAFGLAEASSSLTSQSRDDTELLHQRMAKRPGKSRTALKAISVELGPSPAGGSRRRRRRLVHEAQLLQPAVQPPPSP